MLKLVKIQKTEWERLEALKQKKLEAKAKLERALEASQEDLRKAILENDQNRKEEEQKIISVLKQQIENITQELAVLEEEQTKAEVEHLQAKLDEIAQQKANIMKKLEPYREAYEQAKAKLEEAEQEYFEAKRKIEGEISLLAKKEQEIKSRLNELLPPTPPKPKYSVEEWLTRCREGKVNSYMPGIDPNLDIAYKQYEEEKEAIREWAVKAARIKQATGELISLPEMAKHYSKNRLKEIISATNPNAAKILF